MKHLDRITMDPTRMGGKPCKGVKNHGACPPVTELRFVGPE